MRSVGIGWSLRGLLSQSSPALCPLCRRRRRRLSVIAHLLQSLGLAWCRGGVRRSPFSRRAHCRPGRSAASRRRRRSRCRPPRRGSGHSSVASPRTACGQQLGKTRARAITSLGRGAERHKARRRPGQFGMSSPSPFLAILFDGGHPVTAAAAAHGSGEVPGIRFDTLADD